MGIRPRFTIIVGIDDAKPDDPRYTPVDEEWLEDILYSRELTKEECYTDGDMFDDYHQAELGVPGETLDLADKIYNPTLTGEYRNDTVIGYVVEEGRYDDPIFRALATFTPALEDRGFRRIPLVDLDVNSLRYRRNGYNEDDRRCNRIVPSIFESMPSVSRLHWKRAQHYLKLVGWDIPEEDLHYILVWDWS